MQNRSYMEALFLFTYVDSKGTNEDAWNDWKGSLMMQLYRSTCSFFEDRKEFTRSLRRPEAELKKSVQGYLPGQSQDEIDAHFEEMPERYFRFRGPKSIARHLNLFHRFFEVVTSDPRESAVPLLGWVARPDEGYSLVEVVGWNRHHFLAKVAGALAARNINILSADLYSRADDLVLDIFRVCTTSFSSVTSKWERKKVEGLLRTEFGVGDEEVDFRALIGSEQRPSPFRQAVNIEIPQRVFASNELNIDFTVLELQAQDRLGLLYDVFTVIGDHGMEVVHARISTQAGAAIDRFYLVDSLTGGKILEEKRLRSLGKAVEGIIGA
jgi:[protein-PII] uridylyltransferase